MDIFNQEQINDIVTVDAIISIIVAIIIFGYAAYKFIDYLWFCYKLSKETKKLLDEDKNSIWDDEND